MTTSTLHPPTQPTVEEVVSGLETLRAAMWTTNVYYKAVNDAIALLSALEKDAARYRWLRKQQSWGHSLPGADPDEAVVIWDRYYSFSGEAVDTAIDLARGAT